MHTVITLSEDSLFFQAFYNSFELDWVEIKHNTLALANNIQQGGMEEKNSPRRSMCPLIFYTYLYNLQLSIFPKF